MPYTRTMSLVSTAFLAGFALLASLIFGQDAASTKPSSKRPLIKLLPRFESASVPVMSPEEVEPPNFHPGAPPAGRSSRERFGATSHAIYRRRLQQDVCSEPWQNCLDLFDRPRLGVRRRLDALEWEHSFHANAVHRRDHTGEEGRLALRCGPGYRNSRLSADRPR